MLGLWGVAILPHPPLAAQELPVPATEGAARRPGDCTFLSNGVDVLSRATRVRREIFDRTQKLARSFSKQTQSMEDSGAPGIPQRNFIDQEIFGKLAELNIPSAALSTDEEFFRRIHLDLTWRLPSPDAIRAFQADDNPGKRDAVIDRLLYSPEFRDRWTVWFGDLLQNASFPSNFDRYETGRNAFQSWIAFSLAFEKSLKDMAYEAVTATGNDYIPGQGASNWPLAALTQNGPSQDTYDTMLAKTATVFLGVSHYDCLLCHNGRGHLDQISLWGSTSTRFDAWRMAAHFARLRLTHSKAPNGDPFYNSYDVTDSATGTYDLNTTYGNRPDRKPPADVSKLTPQYRETGAEPSGGNWRAAFAENMVKDPMFARNFANRLWKEFFGLGLVDPVDSLDPARLDPTNPPPDPWTLQATHPALLEKLAAALGSGNFNLREFIRTLVQSSAYQLSSRYDGEWKFDYVPLFARHYPRRLEGEEVHDAIVQATGVMASYKVTGWADPMTWAVQLPEPVEPRSNGSVAAFMNAFLRGNRDTQPRSQSGSILQELNLMNDNFVLSRIKVSASPSLQAVAKLPDNDSIVNEIFLLFLSRQPSSAERAAGLAFLSKATTPAARNNAIEDLTWACINKVDFLFSH